MTPFQIGQIIFGLLCLTYAVAGLRASGFRKWYRHIVGGIGVALSVFYLATTAHCPGACF